MDYQAKRQLDKNIEEAFKKAVVELANEATKIISTRNQWAENPAFTDIVDLGQLRAAQQIVYVELSGDRLKAEIRYPVKYASAVHNGATIRYPNGTTRRIGARPFLRRAAQRRPINASMKRYLK